MKKKSIILILAGMLAVSGMSLAYGASINNTGLNNLKGQMMSVQSNDVKSSSNYRATMMETQYSGVQSNDNFNKMIEIMKENGFTDEANAMENRDFDTMKKLMANMMQSVGRDNMTKIHQSMMGREY